MKDLYSNVAGRNRDSMNLFSKIYFIKTSVREKYYNFDGDKMHNFLFKKIINVKN